MVRNFCGFVLIFTVLLAVSLFPPNSLAGKPETPLGASGSEMAFFVVRSSKATCEPLCPQWISAQGTITQKSPAKFARVLKSLKAQKLPIVIQSPGGNIEAAIEMGRMIRSAKLDVGIGHTIFEGCVTGDSQCVPKPRADGVYYGLADDDRAYCFSACPLVLSSGINRIAGPTSFVGVHEPVTQRSNTVLHYLVTYRVVNGKKIILSRRLVGKSPGKTTTQVGVDDRLRKLLGTYLDSMGISRTLIDEMAKAAPTSINMPGIVKDDELRLTTSRMPLLALVGTSNCDPPKQAENCVKRP